MKWLLTLVGVLVAGSGLAVFDLQQVSRFNSSAIVSCRFSSVVAKPGGGFIAGGNAGGDILIAEFDNFGGLVRSTIWDSPTVVGDFLESLLVYADGKVLMATKDGAGAAYHLVQFSPTLGMNWEIKRGSSTHAALDGSGNAYMATSTLLEVVSPGGSISASAALTDFEAIAIRGIPGPSSSGCIVVGRDTVALQPRAMRFQANATQVFSVLETSTAADASKRFSDLDVEADGDSVISGVRPGAETLTMLSSLGTGSTYGFPSSLLGYVKIRNANEVFVAQVVIDGGSSLKIINRGNGQIVRSTVFGTSFYELGGTGVIEVVGTNRLSRLNLGTNQLENLSAERIVAGTALSGNRGVSVGSGFFDLDSAAICLSDGDSTELGRSFVRVAGAATRAVVDSRPLFDGSIGLIVKQSSPDGPRPYALRYRPDGTLVYARAISFGSGQMSPTSGPMTAFPDGSIAYAERLASNSWGFARVSPMGVLTSKAFPDFGAPGTPKVMVPLSNGAAAVFSVAGSSLRYTQVSSTGLILQEHTYPQTLIDGAMSMHAVTLSSGNLAVAALRSDGSVALRAVNPNTGAAGTSLSLGLNVTAVRLATDPGGNVLVGTSDTTPRVTVYRLRSTNLATIDNAVILNNRPLLKDLVASPNGNTVLVTSGATSELTILGPGNFPVVSSTPLVETVTAVTDLAVDPSSVIYVTGLERQTGVDNVYSARYLPNGVRSAQRRTAGKVAGQVHVAGSGVWVTGDVGTRKKGVGPFAARHSL